MMKTICALAVFVAILSAPASAFDAKRGNNLFEPHAEASTQIPIEQTSKDFGGYGCIPLSRAERSLVEKKLMRRLEVPVVRLGKTYEWRIGNGDGEAFVDFNFLTNNRYKVSVYFVAVNLSLNFFATSLVFDSYGSNEPPEQTGWFGDLWLHFTDDTEKDVVHVEFESRVLVGSATDPRQGGDINRNTRIAKIEEGKGVCTEWW